MPSMTVSMGSSTKESIDGYGPDRKEVVQVMHHFFYKGYAVLKGYAFMKAEG